MTVDLSTYTWNARTQTWDAPKSVADHKAAARLVGDQMRAARKHRGLTQQQLAGRLGVRRDQISHWEGGHKTPQTSTRRQLEQALGLREGALDAHLPASAVSPAALAQAIRETRIELGLSLPDAAKALGVSYDRVRQIESGQHLTGAQTLANLEAVFAIDAGTLLRRAAERTVDDTPDESESQDDAAEPDDEGCYLCDDDHVCSDCEALGWSLVTFYEAMPCEDCGQPTRTADPDDTPRHRNSPDCPGDYAE